MPSERILVVDDEKDVRELCARVLTAAGYRVRHAADGTAAIVLARDEPFDLLLTDIRMPGMSGIQAFEAIKGLHPDIIGVAITGYASLESAIEALQVGMHDFVLKPFSFEQLTSAVDRALTRRRLEEENARLKALIPLFNLSRVFMTLAEPDTVLTQVLEVAMQGTDADLGMLMLRTDQKPAGFRYLARRRADGCTERCHARISTEVFSRVVANREPFLWRPGDGTAPFCSGHDLGKEVSAALAVPLVAREELSGVLGLARSRGAALFSEGDIDLASVLAGQAAVAIQNAELYARLQAAFDDLAKLDHMKSEFISIATHELRTPLAIISTSAAILHQQLPDGEERFVESIAAAADRLAALIDGMTRLKLLEARQVELHLQPTSISGVLADATTEVEPLAATKQQQIRISVDDSLETVLVDGPKLRTVVETLLSNAIKFSPEGTEIHLTCVASADGIEITVDDQGPGIPKEHLKHMFEPFFQIESSLTRKHGGLGIGLALARYLVELQGGRIWVESTAGKGSSFHVTVPARPGDLGS